MPLACASPRGGEATGGGKGEGGGGRSGNRDARRGRGGAGIESLDGGVLPRPGGAPPAGHQERTRATPPSCACGRTTCRRIAVMGNAAPFTTITDTSLRMT